MLLLRAEVKHSVCMCEHLRRKGGKGGGRGKSEREIEAAMVVRRWVGGRREEEGRGDR